MKKFILIVVSVLMLFSIFSFNSFANNTDIQAVWDEVDQQTKEYLEDLGINEISFDDLFNLSPTRVLEFLFDLSFKTGVKVFENVIVIIAILIIISIASAFLKESDKTEKIIFFVGVLTILSIIIVPISRMLTDVATGIKTSMVFVNSYLPVMTAIIVASKNPGLAITYNSFSIFLSSVITTVADKFFMPCVSAILSFNILSSFSFENYRERLVSGFRRGIVVLLALFSTVYTGLLTTQSILASSSDSVVLRGIKFISGAFVPIVGAGVGDALSSVFSSFVIMKNTLGVFVIIVILLINLPVMAELLIWYFALQLCSVISSMLGIKNITDTLDSLSSVISLLNIILFFVTFVLVISTGVIIMMGK